MIGPHKTHYNQRQTRTGETSATEQELLTRSCAGDANAYATIVDQYKTALYTHCFVLLRDENIAEDIAQETFISAYYALDTFNPSKAKLSTWLFTIATNKALNWLKREARMVAADDRLIASITTTAPGPVESALHQELYAAVARLRPKYRAIISLYYWQGFSYRDIARTISAPEGSVKVWMQRAKHNLRKELA